MYLECEVGAREGNGIEADAGLQVISTQHRNALSKARLKRTCKKTIQSVNNHDSFNPHHRNVSNTLTDLLKPTLLARASCSLVTGLDTATGADPGGRLKSESLALTPNSMGGTGRTFSTWMSTPLTGVMGPSRRSTPSEPLRFFRERSFPIGPGLCSLLCSGPASES